MIVVFFFFNDTATTEIYTLSLHDALPISEGKGAGLVLPRGTTEGMTLHLNEIAQAVAPGADALVLVDQARSEEHTSELQSRQYLVCRLLLEKKKKKKVRHI